MVDVSVSEGIYKYINMKNSRKGEITSTSYNVNDVIVDFVKSKQSDVEEKKYEVRGS